MMADIKLEADAKPVPGLADAKQDANAKLAEANLAKPVPGLADAKQGTCLADLEDLAPLIRDAELNISWNLRKLRLYLYEVDTRVAELTQKGAGRKRMEKMVNGGSKPIRAALIKVLD